MGLQFQEGSTRNLSVGLDVYNLISLSLIYNQSYVFRKFPDEAISMQEIIRAANEQMIPP